MAQCSTVVFKPPIVVNHKDHCNCTDTRDRSVPFAVPEWIEDATLAGAPLASYTANHQETYRDTQARPPLPPLIGPKRESWSGQYPSFVRLLVHFCLRHCGCVPSSRASLYLALLSHSSHSPLSLSLTHALSFSISVSSGP